MIHFLDVVEKSVVIPFRKDDLEGCYVSGIATYLTSEVPSTVEASIYLLSGELVSTFSSFRFGSVFTQENEDFVLGNGLSVRDIAQVTLSDLVVGINNL